MITNYMIIFGWFRCLDKSFLRPKINVLVEWVIGVCLLEEWADRDLWWVQEEEEVGWDFTAAFHRASVGQAPHDLHLAWAQFLVARLLELTGNFLIYKSLKVYNKKWISVLKHILHYTFMSKFLITYTSQKFYLNVRISIIFNMMENTMSSIVI